MLKSESIDFPPISYLWWLHCEEIQLIKNVGEVTWKYFPPSLFLLPKAILLTQFCAEILSSPALLDCVWVQIHFALNCSLCTWVFQLLLLLSVDFIWSSEGSEHLSYNVLLFNFFGYYQFLVCYLFGWNIHQWVYNSDQMRAHFVHYFLWTVLLFFLVSLYMYIRQLKACKLSFLWFLFSLDMSFWMVNS